MAEQYEIPLFPLNTVLFPGMILPLRIFEPRYKEMLQRCMVDSLPFGVVLLRSGRAEGPRTGEIYEIGTTAQISQVNNMTDGTINILAVGTNRFRIQSTHENHPYLSGIVEDFPLTDVDSTESKRSSQRLLTLLAKYLEEFREIGKLPFKMDQVPDNPVTLAYLAAIILPIEMDEKQSLLEIADTPGLLQQEYDIMRHELHIMRFLTNEPGFAEDETLPFSWN